MWTPQNGWYIMEHPINMDDSVVPLFQGTSIWHIQADAKAMQRLYLHVSCMPTRPTTQQQSLFHSVGRQSAVVIGNCNMQPRCSMYGMFTYIYPINDPNVVKYTIHGASGQCNHGYQAPMEQHRVSIIMGTHLRKKVTSWGSGSRSSNVAHCATSVEMHKPLSCVARAGEAQKVQSAVQPQVKPEKRGGIGPGGHWQL